MTDEIIRDEDRPLVLHSSGLISFYSQSRGRYIEESLPGVSDMIGMTAEAIKTIRHHLREHAPIIEEITQPKRPWYYWVFLWALALLWNVTVAWPLVLVMRMVGGRRLQWVDGGLWTESKKFPLEKFSAMTVGHGGIYRLGKTGGTGLDTRIELHEQHHTKQIEVAVLACLLIGAAVVGVGKASIASLVVGGGIYYLAPVWLWAANTLGAVLRGGHYYRDSVMEIGARGASNGKAK